ncbi:methylmalonyl CoA epimerase (predicted), isoform CRA_b [Rattus norvegicus]|uniref:Methylmalonyl CoA epimerase (Predicted), isoform CRA_b n=1 Tax=Rattus norvegicus TaxID=10116 RepID=A6JBL7_RAT|nr:methylmalonyl CoA epimerase (predicted), isoform CRA_b [Rattus norvegicus]
MRLVVKAAALAAGATGNGPSRRKHKAGTLGLPLMACSACFLIAPRTTSWGMGKPTIGWTLPHQSLTRKMDHMFPQKPIWAFLQSPDSSCSREKFFHITVPASSIQSCVEAGSTQSCGHSSTRFGKGLVILQGCSRGPGE